MRTSAKLESCAKHGLRYLCGSLAVLGLAFGVVLLAPDAHAMDLENSVRIDGGVTAKARDGGNATNRLGDGDVHVGGPGVQTWGSAGRRGDTSMGTGGSVSVGQGVFNRNGQQHFGGNSRVRGSTMTGDGARLGIAGNGGSVHVGGDVYVPKGKLELGGSGRCIAFRNNRCYVDVHWGTCVLNIVPPGKHGCPPRYTYTGGVCRLFYNFGGHRIEGY